MMHSTLSYYKTHNLQRPLISKDGPPKRRAFARMSFVPKPSAENMTTKGGSDLDYVFMQEALKEAKYRLRIGHL